MLTGSLASSLHGTPRSTHDLDFVIAPTREELLAFVRQFSPSQHYVDEEDDLRAFDRTDQFNLIDFQSDWKADFFFRKNTESSRVAFERRKVVEVMGIAMYVAAPEDIVIAKMEWAKIGSSERQIDDAA